MNGVGADFRTDQCSHFNYLYLANIESNYFYISILDTFLPAIFYFYLDKFLVICAQHSLTLLNSVDSV